jgi:glyoxylase-like metal-dependent hydrolase (beta-lactamase superfamily II)
VQKITPTLWRWTGRHPDWTPGEGGEDGWEPTVNSYALVAEDALVLFDPLLSEEATAVAETLDAEVERIGPPHVFITIYWHARSAQQLLDRYADARVWAYEPAAPEIEQRTQLTDTFTLEDTLPAGVRAYEAGVVNEVVYWLPDERALLTGDVIIATTARPAPRIWSENMRPPALESVRRALRPLRELPVELLLLTHGEPLIDGAREALRGVLDATGE